MVTVVDAYNFLREYAAADELNARGIGLGDEDDRTVVDLLVDQVEFANVIVLNKCDLVDEVTLATIEGTLRSLNPDARVIRARFGEAPLDAIFDTGLFDFERAQDAPGWLKTLRGAERSEIDEYGFTSFVYRARRPFHPTRFWDLSGRAWPGVVRSKGFFWLASRNDQAGMWSQAGGACRIEPAGEWIAAQPKELWPDDPEGRAELERDWQEPWGDRRQEIVIIGTGVDREGLTAMLDAALLTDDEMSRGPEAWARLRDPIPSWEPADEPAADTRVLA